MTWLKLSVTAVTAALFFSAISNTEQFVFTISDGQLVLPLPTAAKGTEVCPPPAAGTGGSQTSTALPPSTTGGTFAVKVIDIAWDGKTCPEGSEASSQRHDGYCEYGNALADSKRGSDARCCYVASQQLFLNALKGGENHLKAKYKFTSRTCCDSGDQPTAYIGGSCEYGNAKLAVPSEELTRCCYSSETQDFVLQMKQYRPSFTIDAGFHTAGQAPNGFCNLGYKLDVKQVRVYGNRIELDISVNVDCATYNGTSSTVLTIYLNHNSNVGGRLTYVLDDIFGPTVYVDLSSKIADDNSYINIHGRITGTGIIGRLEEKFDQTIDDKQITDYLKVLPMC